MSPTVSLSGFPEFSPKEKIIEDYFLDRISKVFQLHGFSHIETRSAETLKELEKKGETSKEVYALSRLLDRDNPDSKKSLGLHFDLTVPFARYVLENRSELVFPFKRYQIQKVWRGERPQEGRFREFTQADIDIVAQEELPKHYELEIPLVMAQALASLPIPKAVIHVNSRKILQGACESLGISNIEQTLGLIDKIDKITRLDLLTQMTQAGMNDFQANKLLDLAEISGGIEAIEAAKGLNLESDLFLEGLDDVYCLLKRSGDLDIDSIVADFKIARGLDYYTGMVYETFLEGYERVGSICSGGRYDNLVSDRKLVFPGVGMSIGITRLLSIVLSKGWLEVTRAVPSVVLVAVDSEETRDASDKIAQKLRNRNIACEVCPVAYKYGKQIRYAERRGIPYVFFLQDSQLKDIRTGEQHKVDVDSWQPSLDDLQPQVKTTND